MPKRPRRSERLVARTSSDVSSIPLAAAPIAMHVAVQEANPARNSQPGVTSLPAPPSSVGMSVAICAPFAWLATMRVPPCQRAVAGASSCRPLSGRRCRTASTRCNAAAISCAFMDVFRVAVRGRRLWPDRRAVPRGDAMSAAPAGRSVSIPGRAANLDAAQRRTVDDRAERSDARTGHRAVPASEYAGREPIHRSRDAKSRETPCIRFRKEAVSAAPSS